MGTIDRESVREEFLEADNPDWKEFCEARGYDPRRRTEFPVETWQREWHRRRLSVAFYHSAKDRAQLHGTAARNAIETIRLDLDLADKLLKALAAKVPEDPTTLSLDELLQVAQAQKTLGKNRESTLKALSLLSKPVDAPPPKVFEAFED